MHDLLRQSGEFHAVRCVVTSSRCALGGLAARVHDALSLSLEGGFDVFRCALMSSRHAVSSRCTGGNGSTLRNSSTPSNGRAWTDADHEPDEVDQEPNERTTYNVQDDGLPTVHSEWFFVFVVSDFRDE
jgi:hypothetical protein